MVYNGKYKIKKAIEENDEDGFSVTLELQDILDESSDEELMGTVPELTLVLRDPVIKNDDEDYNKLKLNSVINVTIEVE